MRGVRCVEDTYKVVQLTDSEAVLPRNYAYWQNINAHRNMEHMLVLVGTNNGPHICSVRKDTLEATPLVPLFHEGHFLYNSTAEGWYWSAFDPFLLYCNDDQHLYRYHIDSKHVHAVADTPTSLGVDIALRQWHSSFDENIHSASVLEVVAEGPWPKIGTIVFQENNLMQPWIWYPTQGDLDESQIDKSGRWLLIKEGDDHRVIDITNGNSWFLRDSDGAAGHSDSGFNYMVAADNWQQLAAWRLHNFVDGTSHIIYETPWDEQVLHVSHCNAVLGAASAQFVLGSGTTPYLMKIYLDGSRVADKVAPSLTVGTDYDALPKASLDPYGEFAFWIAFDGTRYDAYVVKVP